MTRKNFRTQKQRNDLISSIAHTIPVGYEHRMWTVDITQRLSAEFREGKTERAFIKEVERICLELHAAADCESDAEPEGLMRVGGRGKRSEYYWTDKDSRSTCVEGFTITQPRALALFLVKEHISELLPATYLSSLQDDFDIAQEKLRLRNVELSEILDYSPFGISMSAHTPPQSDAHRDCFNTVFEALLNRQVLIMRYDSIHEDFNGKTLSISPQKLRFMNNQLQLLGFVHEQQALKHFVLTKIRNVAVTNEKHFVRVEPGKYESAHRLTLRCHTWVKEFLVTRMLGQNLTANRVASDVWEVSDVVTFPRHFNAEKPDGFYLANFLSMFADAIEVKEPAFLRNEMKRRTEALNAIYSHSTGCESDAIIMSSADNIAKQN